MISVFKSNRKHHPDRIVEALMASLRSFSDTSHFCDDVSIILAKRTK
jgi:serine phosphatase RsbU (regulator of sigma subunit)